LVPEPACPGTVLLRAFPLDSETAAGPKPPEEEEEEEEEEEDDDFLFAASRWVVPRPHGASSFPATRWAEAEGEK
jgi:hypothetical protein